MCTLPISASIVTRKFDEVQEREEHISEGHELAETRRKHGKRKEERVWTGARFIVTPIIGRPICRSRRRSHSRA